MSKKNIPRKLYTVKLADRINGGVHLGLRSNIRFDSFKIELTFKPFNGEEQLITTEYGFNSVDEATKIYTILSKFIKAIYNRETRIYLDSEDIVKEEDMDV